MRALYTAWLAGWCLSAWGCAAAEERFKLAAEVVRPPNANAPLRLAIELRNVSSRLQSVVTLTNLFEGRVHLRDPAGDLHEFIHTNYWKMRVTTAWETPTVELAPGGSYRWEHPLAQFIDPHRLRTEQVGKSYAISFPVLSTEFQPGCEIWCAFDIRQWKKLDETRIKTERAPIVVSAKLKFPQ